MSPESQVDADPLSIGRIIELLAGQSYLADRGLATALYLSLTLEQPLLLEGEAGVGKTDVGKALADALDVELIRLQCYEGIDASQALYEWDYAKQLLHLRRVSATSDDGVAADTDNQELDEVFSRRFLLERPLMEALRKGGNCVLLIDEIDRADDEFEAFLLEILSDFQITVPELGTIRASTPPTVIMTSNRTRELHDALKRRCMYHWIEYPDAEREVEIVRARAPSVSENVARGVSRIVARLRVSELIKAPGVAETINWARALTQLGIEDLSTADLTPTLGSVLKERDDLVSVQARLDELTRDV